MVTLKLSGAQRRAVTDLRSRLAAALDPIIVTRSAEMGVLAAKRAELTASIASIKQGACAGNLEEQAQVLTNQEGQLRIVEAKLKEQENVHEKAETQARKDWEAMLADACAGARELLTQVAREFHDQHRAWFEEAAARYATSPAQAHQIVNLFPFFLTYKRAIRQFEQNGVEPEKLLEWLDSALAGRDFLMPTV